MGGVIHFRALGYEGLQTQILSFQFVFATNEVDGILDLDFINYVMDHVDALRVQELYSKDELRDKLSEFKPDVFTSTKFSQHTKKIAQKFSLFCSPFSSRDIQRIYWIKR